MGSVDIIGWLGTAILIIGYVLTTYRYIEPQRGWYTIFNVLGCIGIGINAWFHFAYPSVILQLVWAVIALTGWIAYRIRQ